MSREPIDSAGDSWAKKKLLFMGAAAELWDKRNRKHPVECLVACRDGEKLICGGNSCTEADANALILDIVRNAPSMVVLFKDKNGDVSVSASLPGIDDVERVIRRGLERVEKQRRSK